MRELIAKGVAGFVFRAPRDEFEGDELRRSKVLIMTRSAKRSENIWKLAARAGLDSYGIRMMGGGTHRPSRACDPGA